ncbi:O-antigen ligase [Paenisporosarcina sp. TG20]|uniref:O-antigen ligase family protein n=1 Tax=Paenisporosarcina sp. TG20 TaxID=1211706 RepID=UPI0002FB7FEC|nr:O-antigen ligase family protein [Paenisporosarcina sp. TG20]
MTERLPIWIFHLLFFMMLSSSFVLIEPSPYDFLMLLVVCSSLFFFLTSFTQNVFIPVIVMMMFLIFQFVSLLFAVNMILSIYYLTITIYLIISWFVLVGIGQKLKTPLLRVVMNGYLISAVISALIGLFAFFHFIPNSDTFLMYGRAKAFFKDPNVFGPFLVLPSLYALSLFEKEQVSKFKKTIYTITLLILLTAILVSFSRAAWGNWFLSFFIYFLFTKKEVLQRKFKTTVTLGVLCIPVLIWLAQSQLVERLFQSRLKLQGYDESRFDTQKIALLTGLRNPFGIGPGQSEYTFQMSPHSLYARILTENGILSILLFVFILFISMNKAFQSYKQSIDDSAAYFLVICASLVGLSFNSFFIDTLHWRHFWLVLALAWCAPRQRGDDG